MTLSAVTRTQGNNAALKDGTVTPAGFEFQFIEVPQLIDAFRRMVRGLEFDVSEMAITTYLCAREHGRALIALPIFLVRAFHHGAILCNPARGIRAPGDLAGTRVGVNRGYTVTTGVWARGVLQEEYGVDLSSITWVRSGDEHVAEYVPPANVVSMPAGTTLVDMLAAGDLAAAIGIEVDRPDVRPLIPNALEAGLAALRTRGHYPINHVIVVKEEVLRARPELGPAIFNAFADAKRVYLDRLTRGAIQKPTAADDLHRRVMAITGDPLPYGIAPNRLVLETLIRHARTQGILRRDVTPEQLFPSNTHALVA